MLTTTQKQYLEATNVESSERHTRCTVTKDGIQLFTLKFNATPTQAELHKAVEGMVRDNEMGEWAIKPIVRQVESAVTFKVACLASARRFA